MSFGCEDVFSIRKFILNRGILAYRTGFLRHIHDTIYLFCDSRVMSMDSTTLEHTCTWSSLKQKWKEVLWLVIGTFAPEIVGSRVFEQLGASITPIGCLDGIYLASDGSKHTESHGRFPWTTMPNKARKMARLGPIHQINQRLRNRPWSNCRKQCQWAGWFASTLKTQMDNGA